MLRKTIRSCADDRQSNDFKRSGHPTTRLPDQTAITPQQTPLVEPSDAPLQAFITLIRQDPILQEQLSTTAAADANAVAAIARREGYLMNEEALVAHASSALLESVNEDWFL